MRNLLRLFRLRREERGIAVVMLVMQTVLNGLVICKYYEQFTRPAANYWNLFVGKFCISGFDPITYYVVSDWEARYNVYRHPLLSFLMYPPYLLNRGMMAVTGVNCVQFIVAAILIFCSFYSFVFMHRILRDVVGLRRTDAALLSFMLFSFAFVMLSAIVPDHFIMSMMLLLLTLYTAGMKIESGEKMSRRQTALLFALTAGISLNNGLKTFMAALFVNGRRFLAPKYILPAVIMPALLMWGFCRFEYKTFVWENEKARHEMRERMKARKKAEERKAQAVADSAAKASGKVENAARVAGKKKPERRQKQGRPIMAGEFMRWTDATTPRWQSVVENLFGESVQLHQDWLLQDEFRNRPMIVRYRWMLNYAVEAIIVLLFAAGVWAGRRSRFMWLCMSFFALDMALHIGLGFGINEVYIMSAHWIYVIPVAVAYLLRTAGGRWLRPAVWAVTIYLYIYNVPLVVRYLV